MPDARTRLVQIIAADIARSGLGDRSMRDLAIAAGTSHRMLNYHFGSRVGLVAAIVEHVEATQRRLLIELATPGIAAGDLVLALWTRLTSPALLPSVRLFFECVAAGSGVEFTSPWLDDAGAIAAELGLDIDAVDLRIGVAITRGLLIDVLTTGDPGPANEAMLRYVEIALPRKGRS